MSTDVADARRPQRPPAVGRRRKSTKPKLRALMDLYEGTGEFFAFGVDVARNLTRRPFQVNEFIEQAWFIIKVSMIPAALVSIPFGAIIALQVGSLTQQLGAQSFTGATSVNGIVREAGPLATALIMAGAAGSAICADFGSRTIREEIDAMKVLGIDPIPRLVVPRVLASMLVGLSLTGLVMGVGIGGGFFFNVLLQGGTPGVYVDSFKSLATVPDVIQSLFKGLVFGAMAGFVGAFKGLRAKGGPRGVGQAVNEAVVIAFLMLFFTNIVITTIYIQLFPVVTG